LDQETATFDLTAVDRADDDAVLVEQSRQGGSDAFGLLYYRYRDRVYRYYMSRAAGREDADDLTQQVFVRAFGSLGQYRQSKGSFASWLFTIVRNIAIDYYRRWERHPAWTAIPDETTSGDDVEEQAIRLADVSRLRLFIADLSAEKQEMLALRFAADLTIVDIAKVVGKSPEATRKQLTRTVQQLEERFDEPA
jgi:RNA polymerase sigma-70 factor (ECF subfamily)